MLVKMNRDLQFIAYFGIAGNACLAVGVMIFWFKPIDTSFIEDSLFQMSNQSAAYCIFNAAMFALFFSTDTMRIARTTLQQIVFGLVFMAYVLLCLVQLLCCASNTYYGFENLGVAFLFAFTSSLGSIVFMIMYFKSMRVPDRTEVWRDDVSQRTLR